VDADAEPVERLHEVVVLALGGGKIDGAEEPVGRVVEGAPERRSGPLYEDVAERRGRAAGADAKPGGDHDPEDTTTAGLARTRLQAYIRGVSGYAATARIRGATPRLAEPGLDPCLPVEPGSAILADLPRLEARDGDTLPSPPPTLAERWVSIRERWSQLTFYVFDSEYWR
jgi:hypothetical protein